MCRKCDSKCVFFPDVSNNVKYIIDEYGIKHKEGSQEYNCVILNKKISMGKKCFKYTTYDEIQQYRKELMSL